MSLPVRRLDKLTPRCAALTLAFAGALATAQPYTTPPPPAAPRPLAIAAPSEMKLANGLRLIVARREGIPLVSAELVALAGAEADPQRLSGLASLSAALMTQGTRRRSAPERPSIASNGASSMPGGTTTRRRSSTTPRRKRSSAVAWLTAITRSVSAASLRSTARRPRLRPSPK